MGQAWSRYQQTRNANALGELAPRKTPGHDQPLPELGRGQLIEALNYVAASITKAKGSVTVITVGGAVNTIYLQSRSTTHDIDFFNTYLTANDYELLIKGTKDATEKLLVLKDDWFNNRTLFFIPMDKRSALTDEAFRQNEIVFQAPGLTVLAAPWKYSFCCKVDRLSGGGRTYDFPDAVQYLSRYLVMNNLQKVSKETVRGWFEEYSLRWTNETDNVITKLNSLYQTQFQVKHNVIE